MIISGNGRESKTWNLLLKNGIIALDKAGRAEFAKMDYADLAKNDIRASNLAVREWYVGHVNSIPTQIDTTQPLETQAYQAFSLRNQYRTEARNLMADTTKRTELDADKPNRAFADLVSDKMSRKGLAQEDALKDIITTATTTNADINRELGVKRHAARLHFSTNS